ncbi:MAG TPA: hypothetical protein VL595_29995 [Pseudonocardia sp.]|jgi:hypothetical protein|nr:hypothetical protein [Pseudonocardia sp.]
MRTSQSLFVIGAALAPLAIIIPGIAMADQPPAPPPPTTPTYICDTIVAQDPAYLGTVNCQPYGGMPTSGIIPDSTAYTITPRNGDPYGNVQSVRCTGGSADTPTSIAPKKCTPIGKAIKASLAPSPVPFPTPK